MQNQPFNLDPMWTVVFVLAVMIGLAALIIWQRRKDRLKKIQKGDSVEVIGAGEYRHITDVLEGEEDVVYTLEGYSPHALFSGSALIKRD